MARLVVSDRVEETEAPFLRGILTRSLQDAGLSFDQAYELASEVRQSLLRDGGDSESIHVSNRKLQAAVIRTLRRSEQRSFLDHYRALRSPSAPVLVKAKDGQTVGFSHYKHQRRLRSSGLGPEEASKVTGLVYEHMLNHASNPVEPRQIDEVTYRIIGSQIGESAAHRYLVWHDFIRSGRPLILMIGGTAGCGKSTVATSIANRLEIVRTQSTDMLREVMRVMVPKRLLPVLHTSSFNAWEELPRGEEHAGEQDERIIVDGYRAQAEPLAVASEAVIQRAMRERVSLILEGVHLHPEMMEQLSVGTDALIVPLMLAVLNAKTLRNRLRGRNSTAPGGRRSKRYLRSFDAILTLQSYLLSEADRVGVPIIRNTDEERVFNEIMNLLMERLSADFTGNAEKVFSADDASQHGSSS